MRGLLEAIVICRAPIFSRPLRNPNSGPWFRGSCWRCSDDVEFVSDIELQDLVAMEAKDKFVGQQEFAGVNSDIHTDS
jgi:hypothetical protein